jgi:hypothetical protein
MQSIKPRITVVLVLLPLRDVPVSAKKLIVGSVEVSFQHAIAPC